ncbi:Membrane protein involved in the export of O-antigen and teichoic acid [Halolactibacillus halophilus]|uniref:Cell division protein YtgP n=2 Tax=Halolactibacillus halophilus TaxID=306540 RepID=A0A1I5Q3Y6_9BACI|nr:polysaccharide biosynthesis protein [Halolactibacillus halophilus]GEM02837.1 putative cell division protein YtgP [Halolactibacillus halophilus]SFP40953.1 Membrane protein involved in the export of O-antigen and teichoic acid [Halolactibacillus halophilus]
MSKNTMLRGTLLLTGASFVSKLLGMLYTIPFESLVGATGGKLYGLAYGPYTIFISLSTVGIPLAVSKFVAKYNSLGDYKTSRRMYNMALKLMFVTGIIAFLLLFFGANILAKIYIPDNAEGITIDDVAMVIKMVSFALLIIPSMSITRGFFQGFQSMGPTAISQVIEQVVRIAFLLTSVYVVLNIFDGTTVTAVGFATFSAFIGAIASLFVLIIYWNKRKHHLNRYVEHQRIRPADLSTKALFIELFQYAGPFVFVGLAIPLYQQIDAITFSRTLLDAGLTQLEVDNAFSNINLYGHKLIMIPITLATGMSLSSLPTLTKSFIEDNRSRLYQQINQSLQVIMLLILPAVVGMSLLSNQIWGAFYGINDFITFNGEILGWYAPVALFFALFTVTSSILQSINQQRFALYSLGIGLVLKAVLNIPLMLAFGPIGAVIATWIASLGTVLSNLLRIQRAIAFPLKALVKRSSLMLIFSGFMSIAVLFVQATLSQWIDYTDGRLSSIIILVPAVTMGAYIYLWFSYRSTLLERVMGERVKRLSRFF